MNTPDYMLFQFGLLGDNQKVTSSSLVWATKNPETSTVSGFSLFLSSCPFQGCANCVPICVFDPATGFYYVNDIMTIAALICF
jgi:hypothetical protein